MKSTERLFAARLLLILFAAAAAAIFVSSFSSRVAATQAQRLCENSDYAVAQISPCTGPTGTVINLTLRRQLTSPPRTLLFKRVLTNGVPAQVRVPVSGLTAPSPPQLCTTGGGRWQVWLIDAAGKSQGVIGAFWPDCSGGTGANSNASGGGSGGGKNSNGGGNNNSGGGGKGSVGNQNGDDAGGGGRIDPCLVGTWEATSVVTSSSVITGGGEGFRVTFKRDGTETVDYSSMKPLQAGNDETTYTGSATARISTVNKTAKVESVEKKGVVINFSKLTPIPGTPLPGLGFGGLGETADDNGYNCSRDSLEYRGSMARDRRANVNIKLTRRKG